MKKCTGHKKSSASQDGYKCASAVLFEIFLDKTLVEIYPRKKAITTTETYAYKPTTRQRIV